MATMSGKQFIRLLRKHGIPLSAFAAKANCKLDSLKKLETKETVPNYYVEKLASLLGATSPSSGLA